MKSAVETLSPTRAKITVEVPFEELKPSLDAAYQSIAKQINIPGFRKGKVPPPVIDRQVGRGAVLDEAINDALPKLYVQALQDNDLQPLAQPEIDVTKLEDNTLFEFTAEVDVRPTIEVPAYDGLSVQVDDIVVSDEDVDEQVAALQERFATLKDVERPAQDGDVVTIDLKATRDGEPVEGGEVSGYSYKVGSGDMLEGIDDALRGLSAGEDKTFTSQLLGGDLSGEDVEVSVSLSAVKEQELPGLDDEFAQTASEFDTIEELREDVATRLERGKRLEQAAAARDAVLEQLLDSAEIPLPDAVVAEELSGRRQEIDQQLMYAGTTMDAYLENEGQTIDEFEAELEKRVRDALASQFLLDEVVKAEEIGVEQDELLPAPLPPCPAVRPEPRRVHQAHGRAQPHPRDGLRGRARQGAGADRRGCDRHRPVRQRGRPRPPAAGRQHRGARRLSPSPRQSRVETAEPGTAAEPAEDDAKA